MVRKRNLDFNLKKFKAIAIIPARLESSRLPQKAILDISGLPMIVHVLKRCQMAKLLDRVYVATDSKEIKSIVEQSGGDVIMTSKKHPTGTDRIAEAAKSLDAEIIVNIQGDEPLVNPEHINAVTKVLLDNKTLNVAILVNPFDKRNSESDIKVVLNQDNEVLYLSRSDIPNNSRDNNSSMLKAYHIVPFRKNFLIKYAKWPKGKLETVEYNEYLRILENGYKIKAVQVESTAISVDTMEDLKFVRNAMISDPIFQQYI